MREPHVRRDEKSVTPNEELSRYYPAAEESQTRMMSNRRRGRHSKDADAADRVQRRQHSQAKGGGELYVFDSEQMNISAENGRSEVDRQYDSA